MGMIRLEPFRDLLTTQKEFNRLFNETFPFRFGDGEEQSTRPWAPPVDIYETESELVFKADLPGVDPKNVDIRVENGILYVKGERPFEKEVKEENYHRIERSYGAFARSFSLPDSIDEGKVKAEYKDGQLTLTMPKREEAKPKAIKINVAKA
ncbi:MAG TPA: Hsp20/alpha crystallin family protein [Terriglobia bacterium]|nr:Hsp20/alpha crystallin family protein [Terriglobia bacterium]